MALRQGSLDHRKILARLIDTAISQGHGAGKPGSGKRWTNATFGEAVGAHESTVRAWRRPVKPVTPPNIGHIIRVLYGDSPDYSIARATMRDAWYRAAAIPIPEPDPPAPWPIQGAKPFAEAAEIIDLVVSQPTPDNKGKLTLPFTLRIHPDRDCRLAPGGEGIAIGVRDVLLVVESDHWQPLQDSVFRGAPHANAGASPVTGGALLIGPRETPPGWIDGKPLGDAPAVEMESIRDGNGAVTMTARVTSGSFVFQALPRAGANDPAPAMDDTANVVLNVLFSGAYDQDHRQRLVIARASTGGRKPSS